MMFLSLYLLLLSTFVKSDTADDPLRQGLPLGYNVEFLEVPVLEEFPTASEFYDNYIQASKPLVIKGALNENNFPALKKWTDEYLRENYGGAIVTAEKRKKEVRSNDEPSAMSLSSFLKRYKSEELYLVAGVQEIANNLLDDVHVGKCLLCGGLQHLLETVVMWFSSGGTKSVLHNDNYENMNCVVDGNKDLIFIDKVMKDRVEADGFIQEQGSSSVDVDNVDFNKFPMFKDLPMYKVSLKKGDCLYIPLEWYHQVNSPGGRSLAVNIWFFPPRWFNYTDCENKQIPLTEPLMKYGLTTPNTNRFLEAFLMLGNLETITKDDLFPTIYGSTERKEEVFNFLDKDGNLVLSWDEIFSLGQNTDKVVNEFSDVFESAEDLQEEEEGKEEEQSGDPHHDEF